MGVWMFGWGDMTRCMHVQGEYSLVGHARSSDKITDLSDYSSYRQLL